jgi:hypothetical protein
MIAEQSIIYAVKMGDGQTHEAIFLLKYHYSAASASSNRRPGRVQFIHRLIFVGGALTFEDELQLAPSWDRPQKKLFNPGG